MKSGKSASVHGVSCTDSGGNEELGSMVQRQHKREEKESLGANSACSCPRHTNPSFVVVLVWLYATRIGSNSSSQHPVHSTLIVVVAMWIARFAGGVARELANSDLPYRCRQGHFEGGETRCLNKA